MYQVSNIYTAQDATLFALPAATYNNRDYLVIDWITFTTDCTADSQVGVEILDSNGIQLWSGYESILANETTTMHVNFQGGLPCFGLLTNVSGTLYKSTQDSTSRSVSVSPTAGTGAGVIRITVAFHFEPASARR